MKRKLLCLSLTSLFLLGCSKKIEEINVDSIKSKIENKEDFIFLIASKTCGHCKNLKREYNKSKYDYIFYEINIDNILDGITSNDSKSMEDYKYLASIVDYSFSNIKSYALSKTYEEYFGYNYETYYGKDEYVEGYVDIVYPLSFFYSNGELVNFELGDYSRDLENVMTRYSNEVSNNE